MKILIIDDERNICVSLKYILDDEGHQAKAANTCQEAIQIIEEWEPDLIILDVKLGKESGLEFYETYITIKTNIPVVMISGHSGIQEAVRAIKLGAYDFLEKPLNLPKVKLTIKNALDYHHLKTDYSRLKIDFQNQYKIIGNSQIILQTLEIVKKLARTNTRVLIRGESGTGKELLAFAIHDSSTRKDMPFIKFNSAAIPSELIESELFGHEKGAFTGAIQTKKGMIELADKGTLFLDEIGDMSLAAQSKILRVLQEGEVQRVGSTDVIKVDTRIIAATHKNLEVMTKQGLFREDLFFRLNVVPLISPPLRERVSDIPLLIEYYNQKFSTELKLPAKKFTEEALNVISKYDFPGNIRELKNLVERLFIFIDDIVIEADDLLTINDKLLQSTRGDSANSFWSETKLFNDKKDEFEKKYLSTQLEMHGYNISKTAEALGLQQPNLSRKIKELNIK